MEGAVKYRIRKPEAPKLRSYRRHRFRGVGYFHPGSCVGQRSAGTGEPFVQRHLSLHRQIGATS